MNLSLKLEQLLLLQGSYIEEKKGTVYLAEDLVCFKRYSQKKIEFM